MAIVITNKAARAGLRPSPLCFDPTAGSVGDRPEQFALRARSETGPSCIRGSVGDRPELLLGFKLTEAA